MGRGPQPVRQAPARGGARATARPTFCFSARTANGARGLPFDAREPRAGGPVRGGGRTRAYARQGIRPPSRVAPPRPCRTPATPPSRMAPSLRTHPEPTPLYYGTSALPLCDPFRPRSQYHPLLGPTCGWATVPGGTPPAHAPIPPSRIAWHAHPQNHPISRNHLSHTAPPQPGTPHTRPCPLCYAPSSRGGRQELRGRP